MAWLPARQRMSGHWWVLRKSAGAPDFSAKEERTISTSLDAVLFKLDDVLLQGAADRHIKACKEDLRNWGTWGPRWRSSPNSIRMTRCRCGNTAALALF